MVFSYIVRKCLMLFCNCCLHLDLFVHSLEILGCLLIESVLDLHYFAPSCLGQFIVLFILILDTLINLLKPCNLLFEQSDFFVCLVLTIPKLALVNRLVKQVLEALYRQKTWCAYTL